MALHFRTPNPADFGVIQQMVIDSFEPITWYKKVDARFGPLNGKDWRARWELRLRRLFDQIVLIGEADGQITAMSGGKVDAEAAVGFIDLLAVGRRFQGRGFGREMLHGMMQHLKERGAVHVHLNCLTDNDTANALYRAEGFEEMAREIHWFRKIP